MLTNFVCCAPRSIGDEEYKRQLQRLEEQVLAFRQVQASLVDNKAAEAKSEIAKAKSRMQELFKREMDGEVKRMAADFKVSALIQQKQFWHVTTGTAILGYLCSMCAFEG